MSRRQAWIWKRPSPFCGPVRTLLRILSCAVQLLRNSKLSRHQNSSSRGPQDRPGGVSLKSRQNYCLLGASRQRASRRIWELSRPSPRVMLVCVYPKPSSKPSGPHSCRKGSTVTGAHARVLSRSVALSHDEVIRVPCPRCTAENEFRTS